MQSQAVSLNWVTRDGTLERMNLEFIVWNTREGTSNSGDSSRDLYRATHKFSAAWWKGMYVRKLPKSKQRTPWKNEREQCQKIQKSGKSQNSGHQVKALEARDPQNNQNVPKKFHFTQSKAQKYFSESKYPSLNKIRISIWHFIKNWQACKKAEIWSTMRRKSINWNKLRNVTDVKNVHKNLIWVIITVYYIFKM